MPNALRTNLKFVAKFCRDNLACQQSLHDTANLNLVVTNSAAMLKAIGLANEADELCRYWSRACDWEGEIEVGQELGENTNPAWQSWRASMEELRDFAFWLAASPQVAAADDRKFSNIVEVPISDQTASGNVTGHGPATANGAPRNGIPKQKRGRRKSVEVASERRAVEAWNSKAYSSYAELAKALGGNWTAKKVKLLVDRYRKREQRADSDSDN